MTDTQHTILDDLKAARAEIHAVVAGKKGESEPEAAPAAEPEAPVEAAPEAPAAEAPAPAEEKPIRIGDQEFSTQEEAFKYAEKLAQEKLIGNAYQTGVQEAIAALKPQAEAAPAPEEDDTEYYVDPKAAIAKAEERATKKALEAIKAEQKREELWGKFEAKYPDIRREDADRILRKAENWNTIGKMDDHEKAMSLLATKVRAEYQEIIDRVKPRSALPNKGGQAVSSGISSPPASVTPKKSAEPTNFIAELKKMRR